MTETSKAHSGKPARPATAKDPLMGFHASPAMRASVVKWAETQPDHPPLDEAVRRLVEIGLAVKPKSRPAGRGKAARATELAAEALASLTVGAEDSEEQAIRRRRLLKGPEEFREVRVDRARKKTQG